MIAYPDNNDKLKIVTVVCPDSLSLWERIGERA
jgi:hypothetical protein